MSLQADLVVCQNTIVPFRCADNGEYDACMRMILPDHGR